MIILSHIRQHYGRLPGQLFAFFAKPLKQQEYRDRLSGPDERNTDTFKMAPGISSAKTLFHRLYGDACISYSIWSTMPSSVPTIRTHPSYHRILGKSLWTYRTSIPHLLDRKFQLAVGCGSPRRHQAPVCVEFLPRCAAFVRTIPPHEPRNVPDKGWCVEARLVVWIDAGEPVVRVRPCRFHG